VLLIIREILDLPMEVIEDRFVLRPGEGMLTIFSGTITGPSGKQGTYHTEMYTNTDSLSLTTDVRLDVLRNVGVAAVDVMTARERHPYIARLIKGATLREYQAHLIPWGGLADLGQVFGDGVLLAGDAGKFNTPDGVGSWPAMASGIAAARAVKHATEMGDFSKATLRHYQYLLDEAGLVAVNCEAQQAWRDNSSFGESRIQTRDHLLRLARRYFDDWYGDEEEYPHSFEGDAYYSLIRPHVPWYVRWPMKVAAWADTLAWRREQARGRPGKQE
jgi:flavin-dependent dehydrogenase